MFGRSRADCQIRHPVAARSRYPRHLIFFPKPLRPDSETYLRESFFRVAGRIRLTRSALPTTRRSYRCPVVVGPNQHRKQARQLPQPVATETHTSWGCRKSFCCLGCNSAAAWFQHTGIMIAAASVVKLPRTDGLRHRASPCVAAPATRLWRRHKTVAALVHMDVDTSVHG